MHIFTIEDQDFPELLELFQNSRLVGRFTENGEVQFVRANQRLVMVSPQASEQIFVKPVRTQDEALTVAKQLLQLEAERGNHTYEE